MSETRRNVTDTEELKEICNGEVEELFRSGTYNCAEAILAVVRKHLSPETPESVVNLVSGLGHGSGSGCLCGALSGGTIALGMVLPSDKERVSRLSGELHAWFKHTYGVTCCKTLMNKHGGSCPVYPGEVAGKLVEMLASR